MESYYLKVVITGFTEFFRRQFQDKIWQKIVMTSCKEIVITSCTESFAASGVLLLPHPRWQPGHLSPITSLSPPLLLPFPHFPSLFLHSLQCWLFPVPIWGNLIEIFWKLSACIQKIVFSTCITAIMIRVSINNYITFWTLFRACMKMGTLNVTRVGQSSA